MSCGLPACHKIASELLLLLLLLLLNINCLMIMWAMLAGWRLVHIQQVGCGAAGTVL
jgi:hypothetical protein